MPLKILVVTDPMIRKARLPDRKARLQSKRKPSLDELNGALQRDFHRRRNQGMKMVRHDDQIMQSVFALAAIVEEDVDEQVGSGGGLKQSFPLGGDGGDEECAVHSRIVGRLP